MKKLSAPPVDFVTALASAISGVGDPVVRDAYTAALSNPLDIEMGYAARANAATLYELPRVSAAEDPIVVGTLSRSDLVRLYTQYFVPEGKPARKLYGDIKVTAGGKCPLCGGIGHVRTLDHYLPKANFPLYSVMPTNLVPCCRDCNSEKLNSFPSVQERQTLHPYFDHDKFFVERWVHARVIPTSPPVLEYFVQPPNGWDDSDRSRVSSHFDEYKLAEKFSVEAAADLPETIQTRRTTLLESSPQEFSHYLAEKSRTMSFPTNNWRRVMFSALAADVWFCSQTFI